MAHVFLKIISAIYFITKIVESWNRLDFYATYIVSNRESTENIIFNLCLNIYYCNICWKKAIECH